MFQGKVVVYNNLILLKLLSMLLKFAFSLCLYISKYNVIHLQAPEYEYEYKGRYHSAGSLSKYEIHTPCTSNGI